MHRKAPSPFRRPAAQAGSSALLRRGLVAAKKAASRKPASPARVVRRLPKRGPL